MSLQDLCRDMKQSFKQNSLGLQTRLTRLDDRMSAVERMQFLIRKQSEEMQDLKFRMVDAERRNQQDQKKVIAYRKKVKELQTSLREMQIRESVRDRAEKELEMRETRRAKQQPPYTPPPQVITVPQPMPIFMPSQAYGGGQAYNGSGQDPNYYQPMPVQQSSYQQPNYQQPSYQQQEPLPALPPPAPSIVELPPEQPPPPPPPASTAAASRRGSVFSVKSFRSKKGVEAK
ncbi:protein enabled homolog isoform X2 [Pollicipes pollicipes]|nr:protein enabled homolog isoform X2 [Pollicipes pollicipes]